MKKYKNIKNSGSIVKELQSIVKQIHEIEDPVIITEYKKLFTDSVGIFSRGHVMAFLIKKYLGNISSSQAHEKHERKNAQSSQGKERERYIKYILTINSKETSTGELKQFLETLPGIMREDIYFVNVTEKNAVAHVRKSVGHVFVKAIQNKKFKSIVLKTRSISFNRKHKQTY